MKLVTLFLNTSIFNRYNWKIKRQEIISKSYCYFCRGHPEPSVHRPYMGHPSRWWSLPTCSPPMGNPGGAGPNWFRDHLSPLIQPQKNVTAAPFSDCMFRIDFSEVQNPPCCVLNRRRPKQSPNDVNSIILRLFEFPNSIGLFTHGYRPHVLDWTSIYATACPIR